jgi:hypothetical protein
MCFKFSQVLNFISNYTYYTDADALVMQLGVLVFFFCFLTSLSMFKSLIFFFFMVVLVSLFLAYINVELFSGFLLLAEFVVVFCLLLSAFHFFFGFIKFKSDTFSGLNTNKTFVLGLACVVFSPFLIENVRVAETAAFLYFDLWENFYEHFTKTSNDFFGLFVGLYHSFAPCTVLICVLLFQGSLICVSLFAVFYSDNTTKNNVFFKKAHINVFSYFRRQGLFKQPLLKGKIKFFKKK